MRRGIAVLLASGLIMAGCGDDDEEEPASTQSEPPAETQSEPAAGGAGTKVSLTEFAIDPANPTAKAGTVTYEVSNDGDAPHALEIEGNGIEEETETLASGGTATLTVELEAGEYKW